jgi:ABC-type multidrug transport system ATPase subunit
MLPTSAAETETNATPGETKALPLDSLEIKGYRCFEHLVIEKLGRVNLIVGKNNAGKTALLEALWVYAGNGDAFTIGLINYMRSERPDAPVFYQSAAPVNYEAPRHLFYNRPDTSKVVKFSIGPFPLNSGEFFDGTVEVSFQTYNSTVTPPELKSNRLLSSKLSHYFVRAKDTDTDEWLELWDEVTLTPAEDIVLNALSVILKIERLSFVAYPKGSPKRIPVVRVNGFSEPVPLGSFGEGLNHLLGIALALVNCQNGMLMIDEIESGLHYSIQPDVWRMIFQTARELNVQVFATTHSYDCIQAFQQAAIEDKQDEGVLIRLENKGGKIRAVTFNEEELATATKREIEVR